MLPEEFKIRMRAYPMLDAEALFDALENQSPKRAFRVNTDKISVEDFLRLCPISYSPIPYAEDGFYTDAENPGSLALHASGAMYMQDPGAMSTVASLDIKTGSKILDVCAAPGGKTAQLSSLAGKQGVVVSNEYVTKRCRILQSNVERLGCGNVSVINIDTKFLRDVYPSYFDCVLVDAPCSGEGMFRKNAVAVEEWSVNNVMLCKDRQREILDNVMGCVAPGGYLVYSTCTFSIEENEENVAYLLDRYVEFELCPVKDEVVKCTADGIDVNGKSMSKTRGFYPHICEGEGQFVAVLKRKTDLLCNTEYENNKIFKENKRKKSPSGKNKFADELKCAQSFLDEILTVDYRTAEKSLVCYNEYIYLSNQVPLPEFGVFSPGICIGQYRNGRIVPHHHLFSALGSCFKNKIVLKHDNPEDMENLKKYLTGAEIFTKENVKGWACLFYESMPVGGVKVSNGTCKNHFPKSLWLTFSDG